MKALTLKLRCTRFFFCHQYIFIFRLDIDELPAETQKRQFFNTNFATKSSFPIKAKLGGGVAKDPRRKSILFSLPKSPPIKIYCQNTSLIHKTSNCEKCVFFSDVPLNFASFDPKLNFVFEPRMHNTHGELALCFCFFQTSYGRFCMSSDRCIGHIPRKIEQNKKDESSVCWLVHDQHDLKKSHPNI